MSNWPWHAHEVVKGTIRDNNGIAMAALLTIEVLFQLFQDLQQARQFDCTSCRTQGDFEHRFSCFSFVTLTEFHKDESIFGCRVQSYMGTTSIC